MKAFFTHWFTIFIGSTLLLFVILVEIVKHSKYNLAHETAVHQTKVDSAWNDFKQWGACTDRVSSDSCFKSAYTRFKALGDTDVLKAMRLTWQHNHKPVNK